MFSILSAVLISKNILCVFRKKILRGIKGLGLVHSPLYYLLQLFKAVPFPLNRNSGMKRRSDTVMMVRKEV